MTANETRVQRTEVTHTEREFNAFNPHDLLAQPDDADELNWDWELTVPDDKEERNWLNDEDYGELKYNPEPLFLTGKEKIDWDDIPF